jgi:hypothetical protein
MKTPAEFARDLFEAAKETHRNCLFIADPEDERRFEDGMLLLRAAALLDPTWDAPWIQQCVGLAMKRKRRPPEMADLAREALVRRETYDALAYLCRSILENHPPEESIEILSRIELNLTNNDLKNVCRIFYAICHYDLGNFREFAEQIAAFRQNKRPEFEPYIAVPVATVRTSPLREMYRSFTLFERKARSLWAPAAQEVPSYIISVSCNQVYLERYARYFFASFLATQPEALCHLAVSDGNQQVLAFLETLECWSELKKRLIVAGWELQPSVPNIGPISASLRFFHVEELLRTYQIPVITVDFDTVFKQPLSGLFDQDEEADAFFRFLPKVAPWEMITGGIVAVRPTSAGMTFASQVGLFLESTLTLAPTQWWIDQNALESAWRAMREAGQELVHKDIYRFRDNYLIQPTGKDEAKLKILDDALAKLADYPKKLSISGAQALGTN